MSRSEPPPLECQRALFDLPPDVHYLNAAYMSPLLRAVEEAGIAGIRRKRFPASIGPDDFFRDADRARDRFARLIHASEPARVAVLPAVSYGIAVAARNTPIERGRNIVIVEGQFPSNALIWRRLARETGAELRTIPAPEAVMGRSRDWNERVLAAIDAATAAVAIAPLHWTDGTRFDLVAIGRRAREHGAAFIVDGTQAVGATPFHADAVGADAVVCAAYKWLLGPYSLAFGWFGPRYDDGTPLEEAWLARAGSHEFRSLVDHVDEYRPAAARYDVGGRSNFVLLPMAIAGMDRLLDWRVERVEAYCRDLTAGFFEEIADLGFLTDEPGGRAPHLFGLRTPPTLDVATLKSELERRRIHVSLRGAAVRLSPHVYNDAGDIEALREALAGAVGASV